MRFRYGLQHGNDGVAGDAFAGFVDVRWPAETAGTVFPFFAALLIVERGFGFHCHARVEPGAFAAFDLVSRYSATSSVD